MLALRYVQLFKSLYPFIINVFLYNFSPDIYIIVLFVIALLILTKLYCCLFKVLLANLIKTISDAMALMVGSIHASLKFSLHNLERRSYTRAI